METGTGVRAAERGEPGFRWRGHDDARLEGFNNAVFGFALALLVVSAEVPQTFDDLWALMKGFVAFAFCFGLLTLIWYFHFQFFRRYGLSDGVTIVLNTMLLFVVLFYVYPLKFLMGMLVLMFSGAPWEVVLPGGRVVPPMSYEQWPALMVVYSGGYLVIFLIFTLLYAHAYRQRAALGLDASERFITRLCIETNLMQAGFGATSIVIALLAPPRAMMWSGVIYCFVGPTVAAYAMVRHRRHTRHAPA